MGRYTIEHREHEFVPDGDDGDITSTGGNALIQEIEPENLVLRWPMGKLGPAEITYELSNGALDVDGDPAVTPNMVGPYRTDWVLKTELSLGGGTFVVRSGMHTLANVEDGETPNERVAIGGKSWLHYFERRRWPYDSALSYVNWPDGFRFKVTGTSSQIAQDILETVRDVSANWPLAPDGTNPSYSLGFTVSADDTGDERKYEIAPFDDRDILAMIVELADNGAASGGDFDLEEIYDLVTHEKTILLTTALALDAGSSAFTLEVDVATSLISSNAIGFTNSGPKATHLLGVGAGTSTRQGGVNKHFRRASAVYRRIDDVIDYGTVKNLADLEVATARDLAIGSNPVHEIPVRVFPDDLEASELGGARFWEVVRPGIFITVNYDFGFHHVNSVQRITALTLTVDADGNEVVDLDLEQYYDAGAGGGLADW